MKMNTIRKTAAIIIAAVISVSCGKQDTPNLSYGSVSGIVTDSDSQIPIKEAAISLYISGDNSAIANTVTGTDGGFAVKNLIPGNYAVEAKMNGYETGNTSVKVIMYENVTADIKLRLLKIRAVINTVAPSSVGENKATSGGTLVSAGTGQITEWGICFGTETAPTIEGNKITAPVTGETFSVELTGLTPNTTYYIRAYAINEAGTAYGTQEQFTTAEAAVL